MGDPALQGTGKTGPWSFLLFSPPVHPALPEASHVHVGASKSLPRDLCKPPLGIPQAWDAHCMIPSTFKRTDPRKRPTWLRKRGLLESQVHKL